MIGNNNNLVHAQAQVVKTIEGAIYRINQKEYNDRERNLSFFLYYLITLMLISNSYNVNILTNGQIKFVVLYIAIVQLPIGLFLFKKRKEMLLILINYGLLESNILADIVVPQSKIFICAAIFAGIALIANFALIEERKLIAFVFFIEVQAVLVQLKVSGVIADDWNIIIMPLTATEICLFIGLAITFLLIIFQKCDAQSQPRPLWGYSMGFRLMVISSHFMQITLPLAIIYFQNQLICILVVGVIEVHHLLLIIIMVLRREHIICSFSLPTQQPLVFQQNQEQSALEKTIQRVSSHWFAVQEKTTINPVSSTNDLILKNQECLICLSDIANMVWVPCGHLATCQKCAAYLIKNKKLSCLLCKKDANHLLKIDMGNPLTHQEYIVQKDISIIRNNIFR